MRRAVGFVAWKLEKENARLNGFGWLIITSREASSAIDALSGTAFARDPFAGFGLIKFTAVYVH